MALDPRYVTAVNLMNFLVDKDTGEPLSNGYINFWRDSQRTVPKSPYELTGSPPNYTYSQLPTTVNLNGSGAPIDNNQNEIALYYFPYDAAGNIDLYFIQVFNANNVLQFSLQAWPNTTIQGSPESSEFGLNNQLINPQFNFVNFLPNNPLTVTNNAGAGTFAYSNLIPGWTVNVTYNGNGSIVLTQTAIAGSPNPLPDNPPYTLTITPGLNITALSLSQNLLGSPNIFAPRAGGTNGYLASSILLGSGSTVSMYYIPNGVVPQLILAGNNTSGAPATTSNTVQLNASSNPNAGSAGYVTISLVLSTTNPTTLTNVQIIGLNSNITGIPFDQETIAQQTNQLFQYYQPQIFFKPSSSYLIGWEFSKNPAQFLTANTGPFASGAGSSNYVWDQTIVFQTANNGFTTSRSTAGGMILTAAANTQLAVIQYLEAPTANELLDETLCSMVEATTSQAGGIIATISLWSTTGALPSAAAGNSLVTGLDANGFPTVAAGWTQVQRNNLGNARFTINQSTVNAPSGSVFSYNQFNNWQTTANTAQTATYFAYVIGFSSLTAAQNITLQSISLQPGYIATIPAPQPASAVLAQCQAYYQKSFIPSIVPANATNSVLGMYSSGSISNANINQSLPSVLFPVQMNSTPVMKSYNPISNNVQFRDFGANIDCSATQFNNPSVNGFGIQTNDNGGGIGNTLGVHWTADARLGK